MQRQNHEYGFRILNPPPTRTPAVDRFACALISTLLLFPGLGCRTWSNAGTEVLTNHNPQANDPTGPRSFNRKRVILDVEFVNAVPRSSSAPPARESSPSLWRWVDETCIDPSVRQNMIRNGIRVGLVNNEEEFRNQLNEHEDDRDLVETFLAEASIASDLAHGSQSMPMRLGRRYELPLRQPFEGSHVAMIRDGDDLIGKTMQNAQYVLALTSNRGNTPEQIELKVHPEIQHGDTVRKWVSSDTALRIDSRRETWQLECLNLQFTAQEGDLIVIAPTQPLHGLAKHMLSGAGQDNQQEQLVLLIRVAQIPALIEEL